jgi:hypothetical protein
MGGPPPPGLNRETMWPAPTEEDWKKPCLVKFQRTWDDALAVAKEENKPILICVNMDGEIASEHYAGIRYRQPETASLYDPYVCVNFGHRHAARPRRGGPPHPLPALRQRDLRRAHRDRAALYEKYSTASGSRRATSKSTSTVWSTTSFRGTPPSSSTP